VTRYIEERRGVFGVEPICRTLGVPVSTHYARRSQCRGVRRDSIRRRRGSSRGGGGGAGDVPLNSPRTDHMQAGSARAQGSACDLLLGERARRSP
jgi:hypothetical protein